MKKAFIAILSGAFLLTSCTSTEQKNLLPDFYDSFCTYEADDIMGNFNVDNDGTVYLYTFSFAENGAIDSYTLHSYAMDGTHTEICESDTAPTTFDVENGVIYGTYNDKLCSFDTATLETTELFALDGFVRLDRVDICGDYVYAIGTHTDRLLEIGDYMDDSGIYTYNGEKLIRLDLSTGEITDSGVEFPISYSIYDGECTVYAADEGGYYFSDFNNNSKQYHELQQLYSFDMFDTDRYIFSSGSGENIGVISAGTTNADDGISQVLNDYYAYEDIRHVGGYTFFKNAGTLESNAQICRFRNEEYVKKNNKISFIASDYSFDPPFGCGYAIGYENLSADSFTLAVLSQDSSYDMCIVNSFESFSANIRDKGSFYPLNDIPEVAEYLDSCFPYVKEAATDENGDIWMLPIRLDIPTIAYHQENCERMGIDFTERMTVEELVSTCEMLSTSEFSDGYGVHPYSLTQNMLIQYMNGRSSFDTPEFRSFAQLAKEKINLSDNSLYPAYMPIMGNAWFNIYELNDGCLFSYQLDSQDVDWLAGCDWVRFAEIPSINPQDRTTATCMFVTINPTTDNLEATLDYVASLAEYLGSQDDNFMLEDEALYQGEARRSLYEVYSNAQIGFNVSEEICYDSYLKYQSGEISLDDMIAESDRKLAAYLNE